MDSADKRLIEVQARIAQSCRRAGREVSDITLIGATKTVGTPRLIEFAHTGLKCVGENYTQEALAKQQQLAASNIDFLEWHLIGALQSNKARAVVGKFAFIHSVDRLSLAQALDKAAREIGIVQKVLLQVNIGGEASKAGCAPQDVLELARSYAQLPNLEVRGLMCLPPYDEDAEKSRPYFRRMNELSRDVLQLLSTHNEAQPWHLSMGMSNDFEIAIEEGATMVRIGTALFGART